MEVEVQDTGIGIKEEDQDKLFKLFGQIQDDQMLNKNGIGLGLTICKSIVEQFNGSISCESEYGTGTNFKFSFQINSDSPNQTYKSLIRIEDQNNQSDESEETKSQFEESFSLDI